MEDKNLKKIHAYVLIADDYIVNRELTKEMLEMMDCDVDTAANGREALELYNQNKYDCILMDIQMPEMDGLQVTREIRSREKKDEHVIIIALTANDHLGDEQKCLDAGMDGYLSKPVKSKDLESYLSRFLT